MEFSVIFPAYNEEASLAGAIERSLSALRKVFREFEIVIVDDGSRDATGRIADELAAKHPEVRVLHNERNMGAGESFVRGLAAAKGELIMHNGVDLPFDMEDVPKLVAALGDADVVVAARQQRAGYTAFRVLTSVVNVTLLNVLFGLHLKDYNFVQLYRRKVIEQVRIDTRSTAFVTPELIIRAHDQGFRVVEAPIEYHARTAGVATSGTFKVISRSMRDMALFYVRRRRRG